MDANLNNESREFLGPEYGENLGESSFIYYDSQFLKQFNLSFQYPFFLKPIFHLANKQLLENVEELIKICLDLDTETLIRNITLNNTLYTLGINLRELSVYFFSQRLADECFLDSVHGDVPEDKGIKKFIKQIKEINIFENPTEISVLRTKFDLVAYDSLEILNDKKFIIVSQEEQRLKEKLIDHIESYRGSFFEKISDYLLVLTSDYDLIRIHLLKFLAVLPCLDHDKSGEEVKKIFLETLRRFLLDNKKAIKKEFSEPVKALPNYYIIGLRIVNPIIYLLPARLLSYLLRTSTRYMAKRFIAGENITNSKKVLTDLDLSGRNTTIDQLGELVLTEEEANLYQERVLELIYGMKSIFTNGERNKAGILKAHVSIKVSALASNFIPEAFDYCYEQIAPRLEKILLEAQKENVFVNIDAEHFHYRDIVWEIYKKVLSSNPKLYMWEHTGIVIQAYLKDAFEHFNEIRYFSKIRQIVMPVRLVKGAYWDAETVEASAHSDIPPQFINKVETDIHFRQMTFEILNEPFLQLCIASHNLSDHCFAQALREKQLPHSHPIEHQCLHMTYEALSLGLSKMGYPVRNYMPVGDLLVGMAYLVRRIMENSSQVGILAMMRSHRQQLNNLELCEKLNRKIKEKRYIREENILKLESDFFNHPPLKTYLKKHRDIYQNKGNESVSKFGDEKNNFDYRVYSPSNQQHFIGGIKHYKKEDANKIIDTACAGFLDEKWRQDFNYRARCFVKASHLLKLQRNELAHLIVYEAGKTHIEALADVDEAIDFIDFYLRAEFNFLEENPSAIAKGIILVIAPWNFPLAIPCGMTVASLVAGNAVCLKSAEQTPLIAEALVKLLHQSGIPQSILQHTPGKGPVLGKALGEDQRIAGVVFTGSKEVGCSLFSLHSSDTYNHLELKKLFQKTVITEMGGKNAIIITNNCELDETVAGVLYSSFGHSGQKCSAASRILVHKSIKNSFLERFLKAAETKVVGDSDKWETSINPLISLKDKNRFVETRARVIEECSRYNGNVYLDKTIVTDSNGCHVGPLIVELPMERALKPESESQKEHFAPVVHIIEYENLAEALKILNSSEFALTAGIYSQSQDEIDIFIEEAEAGNLYINRPCTGARVGIEPFGGFKFSGTGPKAGSKFYLRDLHVDAELNRKATSVLTEEGSSYFTIPHKTKDILTQRLKNILKIEERDRDFYNKFSVKLDPGQIFFNKIIPGQLSYDVLNHDVKNILVVLSNLEPSLFYLRWVLASYLSGHTVTVVCTNEHCYSLVSEKTRGFDSVEVLYGNFDLLDTYIFKNFYDRVIFEADDSNEAVLVEQYQKFGPRSLAKLISSKSGAIFSDDDYLSILLDRKSLAVNTMRHGAPLNLS